MRCSKTVDWEKTVGITAVSIRNRPEEPGTRVEGHGRNSRDYNSFNQKRARVVIVKDIYKTADKRTLDAYPGKTALNVMERVGVIKHTLSKDLGD